LKALARAIYWQHLWDTGRIGSVGDIATAEGKNRVKVHKTQQQARLASGIAQDTASGSGDGGTESGVLQLPATAGRLEWTAAGVCEIDRLIGWAKPSVNQQCRKAR